MADEGSKNKLMKKLSQVDREKIQAKMRAIQAWVRKFIITIGLVSMFLVGFFLGARMHELGVLAGVFGKDLKGATVKITGSCLVDGDLRDPALAQDEVIVTTFTEEKLIGVVRRTREVVECQRNDIAIETLPLLKDISTTPSEIPEITMAQKRNKVPQYKLLENKILIASGTCRSQLDGKELPSFTDERIDVTSVEESKENASVFVISGIMRSNKMAVSCSSRSIRYTLSDGTDPVIVEMEKPKVPVTFVGKTILVTSRCLPDPGVRAPRGADGRKVAFYRLVNTEVQVIAEDVKDDKLVKFQGSIVDKKSEGFGQLVVCDQSKFPFTMTLKENNEDVVLERADSQKSAPEVRSNTTIETEEDAPKAPSAPTSVEKEIEKEKELLLKQLDGGPNGQ